MRRIIVLTLSIIAIWSAGLGIAISLMPPSNTRASSEPASYSATERIEAMGIKPAKAVAAPTKSANISYHNGPIITGTTNLYLIWYGNWSTNQVGQTILTDFVTTLGGTPYFAINTTYYNSKLVKVSNSLQLKGSTTDAYSQTATLTDAGVKSVVASAITSGRLPNDTNAVYLVLSSADVTESSGFITKYCGWHAHATISASDIKYSFVGDPTTQGINNCAWQSASSPNGNPGADAMVSVVAHEIDEAVTDPDLNAWYDSAGAENADKCAWMFGTTYKAANGSLANMKIGARDYLVQQNWKAGSTQGCALTY